MKDFYSAVIFALALLAATVVVLVFKYGQQRVYTKTLEAQNVITRSRVADAASQAERIADAARLNAEKNLRKAREAGIMLEKVKAKGALTQKQIVEAMNRQLEREAEARLAAEKASIELSKQRDELSVAVSKTRAELENLQKAKVSSSVNSDEIDVLRKLLKVREAEIERLKLRQIELERLRAEAAAAQEKTEREIEGRGGTITLPVNRRMISPNIRAKM